MGKSITQKTFEAFQEGDSAAFVDITTCYYSRVKSFVRHVVKVEMDVQEITQDVFLKLWENREKVYALNALNAYLFRLSLNEAFSFLKKTKKDKSFYADKELTDEVLNRISSNFMYDSESEYDMKELSLLITLKVKEMPKQRKEIFELSRNEGLSNNEIAQRLKISVRTVESHIYRALIDIKETLL